MNTKKDKEEMLTRLTKKDRGEVWFEPPTEISEEKKKSRKWQRVSKERLFYTNLNLS